MKKRTFLIIAGCMVLGTLLVIYLLPRFLMRAAIEKPQDVGEFVTAPVEQGDFKDRVEAALTAPNQAENSSNTSARSPLVANSLKREGQNQNESGEDSSGQNNTVYLDPSEAQTDPNNPNDAQETKSSAQDQTTPNTAPMDSPEQPARTVRPTPETPATSPGSFQLQMSEQEIAGMIYNGMSSSISPQYKEALQGVSVQLRNGRAKITVKLLPKYLPKQYLESLPGIDRNSPPLYMGGEVVLQFQNNTIQPKIYNVSLGNLRVPIPAIESVIKNQIQAQMQQITRLRSGQQIQLESVNIQGGLLTVTGRAN